MLPDTGTDIKGHRKSREELLEASGYGNRQSDFDELVRILDNDVVNHFRIDLKDNDDGTCTGTWTLKMTAISERGNEIVESLPDRNPLLEQIIAGLDHFVTTGEMMRIAA